MLLTISTASTEAAQRGEVTHPQTHSVAEPPPLPPSRRSAGSGVGSCGGRARHGKEDLALGAAGIGGGGACTRWRAVLPRNRWAERGGQHLGGWGGHVPEGRLLPGSWGPGTAGRIRGLGSCTGWNALLPRSRGSRDSGPARGLATASSSRGRTAAALLRVAEGREGGGPVSPASVAIAGLAGRPGHRSVSPRADPRRAPLPAAPFRAPAARQ